MNMKKISWIKCIKNLKTLKYHYIFGEKLVFFIVYDKCGDNDEKIFEEED